MPPDHDEYFLDPRAVRRAFDAASATYEEASRVQAEMRNRLLERLDIVRTEPRVVLDLGSADGVGARALKDRYPRASVIALDLSIRMLQQATRRQRFLRRFERVAGDAQRLPLRNASVDLVFSNLLLEWCHDPDAAFREICRVLRPQGLFVFTTLGPDTLKELREAWRGADAHVHVHRFIDMHDVGDALMRARFTEPVMDVERLSFAYRDLNELHGELRKSGSANLAHGRPRGLTSRGRQAIVSSHLEAQRRGGVLPMSVEVVFGHAWGGDSPLTGRSEGGEIRVPISALQRRPKS